MAEGVKLTIKEALNVPEPRNQLVPTSCEHLPSEISAGKLFDDWSEKLKHGGWSVLAIQERWPPAI